MDQSDIQEMFEPFDRLIEITVCGETHKVPENNSILRALQFLKPDEISYGDFCWNGECLNCNVWVRNGDKEKKVIACRTNVSNSMEVVRLSDEIKAVLS